jgi:hypothetical protein
MGETPRGGSVLTSEFAVFNAFAAVGEGFQPPLNHVARGRWLGAKPISMRVSTTSTTSTTFSNAMREKITKYLSKTWGYYLVGVIGFLVVEVVRWLGCCRKPGRWA